MSYPDKIEVGDIVHVSITDEGTYHMDATVLYTPQATGDAWHIRTKKGRLVYVQQYAWMELHKKSVSP